MPAPAPSADARHLGDDPMIGPAELRNHFDGSWAGGFEVVAAVPEPDGRRGYRVIRRSDGTALPVVIAASDIRRSSEQDC